MKDAIQIGGKSDVKAIPFSKFHGFGNDYIVLDSADAGGKPISDLARDFCERRRGAGADGLAVITQFDGGGAADFFCEIVNPDGSIAQFSGNGTRCAAAHLYRSGRHVANELRLETKSGVKLFRLLECADGQYIFESEIGRPKFAAAEIPMTADGDDAPIIEYERTLGGRRLSLACVNVGNPAVCAFVENFEFDWRAAGRELEMDEMFPERTNVVFANVIDREHIRVKIWERGAGETASSGTCSSAAAVLSAATGRTARAVDVAADGGTSRVAWRAPDDEIILTGAAVYVYSGLWTENSL